LQDGAFVLLDGIVSAVFDGFFYLEDKDRAGAVRIESTPSVMEGKRALVSGRMSTANGERCVIEALVTVIGD